MRFSYQAGASNKQKKNSDAQTEYHRTDFRRENKYTCNVCSKIIQLIAYRYTVSFRMKCIFISRDKFYLTFFFPYLRANCNMIFNRYTIVVDGRRLIREITVVNEFVIVPKEM